MKKNIPQKLVEATCYFLSKLQELRSKKTAQERKSKLSNFINPKNYDR